MEILRVLNNNVVLAREDHGGEIILTGRGLGFNSGPGEQVDENKVVRRFVPSDGRDVDHLAEMVAMVAPEYILLVSAAMSDVGLSAQVQVQPTLVIALADHISCAVKRQQNGLVVEYPLKCEVTNLYAQEYCQAVNILERLNERLPQPLALSEAVALTLHLVNAGFSTGDLSGTYQMTGIIHQMIAIIEQSFGISLDMTTISSGRFITHVRYLFVRIYQHQQLTEKHASIGHSIREAYPEALKCSLLMANLMELRLGEALSADEISYLTLHVARVVDDSENDGEC